MDQDEDSQSPSLLKCSTTAQPYWPHC